jgi:hypothetical protein
MPVPLAFSGIWKPARARPIALINCIDYVYSTIYSG